MTRQAQLTEADRTRVAEAVRAAEGGTAGEIVTIVTEQSDSYHDAALVWSAVAAVLAIAALAIAPDFYLGLWDRFIGGWTIEWTPRQLFELAAVVAALKFGGTWLILL